MSDTSLAGLYPQPQLLEPTAESGVARKPLNDLTVIAKIMDAGPVIDAKGKVVPGSPPPELETPLTAIVPPTVKPVIGFYGTEAITKKGGGAPSRTPAQQLARASWLAPLIALAVITPTLRVCTQHPTIALLVGWVTVALVVVGLLCGVGVLRASYVVRRDGIFAPALMGLCFNGMLAGLSAGVYLVPSSKAIGNNIAAAATAATAAISAATHEPSRTESQPARSAPTPVAQPHRMNLGEASVAARHELDKYAGWYGVASAGPAVICVGEFSSQGPVASDLRSRFPVNPRMMLISIDNSRGSKAIAIDPSSLWIETADGHKITALPARVVLSGAKDARDRMIDEFGSELRAEPGDSITIGFAFLPSTADLKSSTRLTMQLNGHRIAMSGKYLSVDQKAAIGRLAAAMASR